METRTKQRPYAKIGQSKYTNWYKCILTVKPPEYLGKEEKGQKLIARARCGNLENCNRY